MLNSQLKRENAHIHICKEMHAVLLAHSGTLG